MPVQCYLPPCAETNSNLLPSAYGTISAARTLQAGTSNGAISYNAVSTRYGITITGEAYRTADYRTLVTPISSTARSATTGSSKGTSLEKIFKSAGTAVADNVNFVVYTP